MNAAEDEPWDAMSRGLAFSSANDSFHLKRLLLLHSLRARALRWW